MRWRGLLVRGLHMCELEGREGPRGYLFWSQYLFPSLYGDSPFWVICFLIQKKIQKIKKKNLFLWVGH